jgi:hypothetical protein
LSPTVHFSFPNPIPVNDSSSQDAHVVLDAFAGDPEQGFFAIYDGHGGRGTVDFVAKRLHEVNSFQIPPPKSSTKFSRFSFYFSSFSLRYFRVFVNQPKKKKKMSKISNHSKSFVLSLSFLCLLSFFSIRSPKTLLLSFLSKKRKNTTTCSAAFFFLFLHSDFGRGTQSTC